MNISNPNWDVTRFDPAFFNKGERAIRAARERDIIISVVFFLDGEDAGADAFGKGRLFGDDARPYYRYVNARFGAYSNVTWDVTNEWHLFRNAWWVEQMGTYLRGIDPYHHLISTHGRGDFPWALSQWPDFALYQLWDESGRHEPMRKRRESNSQRGIPIPQINEEYGYEDTYPEKWGGNRRPPSRNADWRRRLAWEIAMAGCYQTTGENANRNGDGKNPATPGGWISGGFDDSMHMLEGYRHMVDFFESLPYWKLEAASPHVLAESGVRYVVYLPAGGQVNLVLSPGRYRVRRFEPLSGHWTDAGSAEGGDWTTPESPVGPDVVYGIES